MRRSMTALQGYNIHLHTPWRGIRLETMIRQFVRRNSAISSVARRSFGSGGGTTSMSVFDYETITAGVKPSTKIIEAVEHAFGALAKGKVEVPPPMHIGISESANAGPGDCHIKGGYIEGAATWTVKLANVSFYKNVEKGLPIGSGVFVVCDATNGFPLGIFQDNRYLTDMRTGAAGAICVKHFVAPHHKKVGYIGAGVIGKAMARASHQIHKFEEGYVFGLDKKMSHQFADELTEELGFPHYVCDSSEEACRAADCIFTQTPGTVPVLELGWLKPHATIIASGSDQPTKNEIPSEVMRNSKFIADLKRQCVRVGELRTAIKEGAMSENDVYAEIGDVINGTRKGREGDELIVVDLTGTGAQDAAIGQVAWEVLSTNK